MKNSRLPKSCFEFGLSMGIQARDWSCRREHGYCFISCRGQGVIQGTYGPVDVSLVTIFSGDGTHDHPSLDGKIPRDFAAGSYIIGYISLFTRVLDGTCWRIFWGPSLPGHVAARLHQPVDI